MAREAAEIAQDIFKTIADDIECAKQWLTPGDRPPQPIEIANCISELEDLIKQLRKK
jgi:hypothetical protein